MQAAVFGVGAKHRRVSLAQAAAGVGFPPVPEAPQPVQLDGAGAPGEQPEGATGGDGVQLVGVTDQQHLRSGLPRLLDDLVQGHRGGGRSLVDDEQLVWLQRPAGLFGEDAFLGGLLATGPRCPARGLGLRAAAPRTSVNLSARRWAPGPEDSCNHLALFSQSMPSASARFAAAEADGASPMTDPVPCSCSQTWRRVCRVAVFPEPAGPTSRSSRRPEVARRSTASTCS